MNDWIPALQATALCLSLLWFGLAVMARPRSPLSIVWALFCGSIAMAMARSLVGAEATLWYQALGLGACLTCNGFWLVARALFREGRPFGAPHMIYAGIVAALIIASQQKALAPGAFIVVTSELLQLLSSVVLVLAFWEGLRGWGQYRGVERSMRMVFMATYGGCVATCFLVPPLLDPAGTGGVGAITSAMAASAILLVSQGLVTWRLRHPLGITAAGAPADLEADAVKSALPPDPSAAPSGTDAVTCAEDAALAKILERHMREEKPYLSAELKLNQLSQALDVSEYRISRAVRATLRHRNINHYVNSFRLDHARGLLADPSSGHWSTLVVGLESGFGSLGAFHRAFKAAEGCTPGAYRAVCMPPDADVQASSRE